MNSTTEYKLKNLKFEICCNFYCYYVLLFIISFFLMSHQTNQKRHERRTKQRQSQSILQPQQKKEVDKPIIISEIIDAPEFCYNCNMNSQQKKQVDKPMVISEIVDVWGCFAEFLRANYKFDTK